MKFTLLLIGLFLFDALAFSQNVGIGTTEPVNKLEVHGNLLVTAPTTATSTAPTIAQAKTMVSATTILYAGADSTGRIYDPGGPAGNYLANMQAYVKIDDIVSNSVGIEITVENIQLGSGDSLIIKQTAFSSENLLAFGNANSTTGKWIFNSAGLYILFKSNADGNTGAGFSIFFRRLYDNSNILGDVSSFAGEAFFFDAKKGAIRTGTIINTSPMGNHSAAFGRENTASGPASIATGYFSNASGLYSVAMGYNNKASGNYSAAINYNTKALGDYSFATGLATTAGGDYSTALGTNVTASGDYSTAIGRNTTASGLFSTAMGNGTTAGGDNSLAMGQNTQAGSFNSTAMGFGTIASGFATTAMGVNTTASGDYSTAMGNYVSTNNQNGSFVIGDNSTTAIMTSANQNNFRARFAGGYKLFTSANLSTGCTLFAGDNAWTTGSDVRTKENFAEVNGEDFLKKINGFHLTSWNYKTQNPSTFRHYGPMAQDFYAAFGKDKYGTIGNDTTINSADFAGVSLIAIQALEKRTAMQQVIIDDLRKENSECREMILQLKKEMNELKKQNSN